MLMLPAMLCRASEDQFGAVAMYAGLVDPPLLIQVSPVMKVSRAATAHELDAWSPVYAE